MQDAGRAAPGDPRWDPALTVAELEERVADAEPEVGEPVVGDDVASGGDARALGTPGQVIEPPG